MPQSSLKRVPRSIEDPDSAPGDAGGAESDSETAIESRSDAAVESRSDAAAESRSDAATESDSTARERTPDGQSPVDLAAFPTMNPSAVLAVAADGEVLYRNPAARDLEEELDAESLDEYLPENHAELVDLCLSGDKCFHYLETSECNRIFSWTYVPHAAAGQVHVYGVDITDRKRAQNELLHEAFHDALTQLPNRALFLDRLRVAALRAARRPGYLFAVLFMDLDRFKAVNDSLGHGVGDKLLRGVAERLQTCLRPEDTLARFGGDEFAILLEELPDVTAATHVAERIQSALATPFDLDGNDVFTTASIGIAISSMGYEEPDDLVRDADRAMYRAKAHGRARYEVFDTEMHAQAMSRLQVEGDLRGAISHGRLRLHFQPVVELESRRVVGLEALVRWPHPNRGLLGPADFIDVAEDTGMILELGNWVLNEACRQMVAWGDRLEGNGRSDLWVSVNLSSRQILQPELVERVGASLEGAGLEPGRLRLEVTEGFVLRDPAGATRVLDLLRDLGVDWILDDFGTGYSSLGFLHQARPSALKADHCFVADLTTDGRDRDRNTNEDEDRGDDGDNDRFEPQGAVSVVGTIIGLADSLGVAVIAEGVETSEQLQLLRSLGCRYGQGALFSMPVAVEDVVSVLDGLPLREERADTSEGPS